MKFARIVFLVAGIWGVLVITPLFFIFNRICEQDPPPITHPGFYYGFATTALAWQIAFFVIASNPARLRPLMIPSFFEKLSYATVVAVLFVQGHMRVPEFVLGIVDLLFGVLFVTAFVRTADDTRPAP
jgi:hypothetical protein